MRKREKKADLSDRPDLDYTKHDNAGLVAHVSYYLNKPTAYLWGGMGQHLSFMLLLKTFLLFPKHATPAILYKIFRRSVKGTRLFDCSGLVKRYLMTGPEGYRFDKSRDKNSKMLLELSERSGTMDTLPEIPGLIVYMPGHMGVYIGNGKVVESTSNEKYGYGVIKTDVCGRGWKTWFYCPWITYSEK